MSPVYAVSHSKATSDVPIVCKKESVGMVYETKVARRVDSLVPPVCYCVRPVTCVLHECYSGVPGSQQRMIPGGFAMGEGFLRETLVCMSMQLVLHNVEKM